MSARFAGIGQPPPLQIVQPRPEQPTLLDFYAEAAMRALIQRDPYMDPAVCARLAMANAKAMLRERNR